MQVVPAWHVEDPEECRPVAALWRGTAASIRELVRHRATVVHVGIDGLPPIVIDTRYRAYGWRYPLTGLPPAPAAVTIEVQSSAPMAPAVFSMRNGAVSDLLDAFETLAAAEAA